MKRMRLGIIGCGVIGRTHLNAASRIPRIEVTAVADVNPLSASAAAESFGIPIVHRDGRSLIDDLSVDAVILALPACARLDLALYALGKGKHVLIEKPTGMDAGEVEKIMQARGTLVAASCTSRLRYLESARVLADFIASGTLGELRMIRYRMIQPVSIKPQNPPAWRFSRSINGGGIMANWGTYDLDYLFGITGGRLNPLEVTGRTWTVADRFVQHVAEGSDAETHAAAFIRCDGGAVIVLERGELVSSERDDSWEVIGENGSLSFHMLPVEGKEIWLQEGDKAGGIVRKRIWQGSETWDSIALGLLEDFTAAVLDGRRPLGSLEDALVVQSVIDAIYRSSETGSAVPLNRNAGRE